MKTVHKTGLGTVDLHLADVFLQFFILRAATNSETSGTQSHAQCQHTILYIKHIISDLLFPYTLIHLVLKTGNTIWLITLMVLDIIVSPVIYVCKVHDVQDVMTNVNSFYQLTIPH